MKKLLIPLVLFLVLAGFLFVGLSRDPREVPSPLIGRPAPAFEASVLADPTRRLGLDNLRGQVWVLNVWASWCVACREEHPVLMRWARENPSLMLVGLDYKDERPAGLNWLARGGDPYKDSIFDADGRIGLDWGVYGVPETFVIDREGVVRLKHTGPLTPEVIQERIAPLLKQLHG